VQLLTIYGKEERAKFLLNLKKNKMNKKTQLLVGVFAVGAVAYWLLNRRKDPIFANLTAAPQGCTFVQGNVNVPVGTTFDCSIGRGKCVITSTGSGQTLVCPVGQTSVTPIKF